MKSRYLPLVLIAVLLLAFGAIAAGCGSDDDDVSDSGEPLTLAAWFGQLEGLSQAFAGDLEALDEEAGPKFDDAETDDVRVGLFISLVGDRRSATDDFVSKLDALSGLDALGAPAEVTGAHSEAVTAGRNLVSLYDDALSLVDPSGTFDDAALVLESPGVLDGLARFGATCVALQGVADSNGIDVDMRCPS